MSYDSRDYYKPSGFGGFTFFPPVIKNLLIINVAVFVLQMLFDMISFGNIPGGYILNHYFALNPIGDNFQIWQLITYQFMHGSFTHIFFNMFILWMFGIEIEQLMGSQKFLFFYLLCGVGAGIFQTVIPPILGSGVAPTIGASGAVFGVMMLLQCFSPIDIFFFISLSRLKQSI